MPGIGGFRRRFAGRVLGVAVAGTAAGVLGAAPGPAPRELRVCADPNNLPFSNRRGEGFENRLAELIARDLGIRVRYEWMPQMIGFVRKTLKAGACDVIMGVPARYDPVLTTRPYYRSTYVFVYRAHRGPRVTSLDDPVLRHVRIGIHVVGDDYTNPPPAQALAARGIIDNVIGYPIIGDYSKPNPPARLIEAVARGDVDIAVVWGPFAGYFAKRSPVRLAIVPVLPSQDASGQPFAFDIALGVRHGDTAFAARLDALLLRERPAVRRVLARYGVPQLPVAATAATGAAP
jgi:quinoprotein dehydrogenase-associated probable ABC transporter substrate-binding protein